LKEFGIANRSGKVLFHVKVFLHLPNEDSSFVSCEFMFKKSHV